MGSKMDGRTVLITGANSGIGLVTAKRLAGIGAEVIMACRDARRGASALDEVGARATFRKPVLLQADLASQASIRCLAATVGDHYGHIDVLLNNAGAVFARRELSEDGIERTFATNHLAPFLLTILLLPLLRQAQSGRIVTVASRIHAGDLAFDNLQGERRYSTMEAYGRSKLENILFTYELARRLGPGPLTANCLAPGLVSSNFGRNAGGLIGLMPRLLALTPLSVSPEEGARTSIYLASSSEVNGVTGAYFYKCKADRSKPITYDRDVARRLWDISAGFLDVPTDISG